MIPEGKSRRWVTLSNETWAWLESKAAQKRWQVSQAIEEAVQQWIGRHGSKSDKGEDEG